MPHFTPSNDFHHSSPSRSSRASSETLRSATLRSSGSPSLAPRESPHQQESRLQLLTSPFIPKSSSRTSNSSSSPNPSHLQVPSSKFHPSSTPPFTGSPSYNYSPILPMTPSPSRPVSTASIPPFCYEELVIHHQYGNNVFYVDKNMDPDTWEGPIIDFLPIPAPANQGTLTTPMRDCLHGFGLKNPEERLFRSLASAGKTHIEFRIMWPGYSLLHWTIPISIYDEDSQLVTRRELAHRIACQYQNYAQYCELQQLPAEDQRWRIGPGGYTFERMRLSGLQCVEEDTWQAHVTVLTDLDVDHVDFIIPMRDLSKYWHH